MNAVSKVADLDPDTVRSLRGPLSRADFARKVGVTPLTVYRWELPDGAPESRRPRGAVAERLRRAIAHGDLVDSAPSQRMGRGRSLEPVPPTPVAPGHVDPDDAAAILPSIDHLLRADFKRAEDDLMHLLVAGELRSAGGRAMAQAALAIGQVVSRHDPRSAFTTLQPALRDADALLLPAQAELLVRAAASLVFSMPDGRLFDIGRINAQVTRGERLVTRDTSPDLLFLLRLGGAVGTLYAGGAGRQATEQARASLAEVMDLVTEPVSRLTAEELRAHFQMIAGPPALVTRKFEDVAERAATLGVAFIAARCLAFVAVRLTDEVVDPQRILDVAQRAKTVAARARLGPGLHSIFSAKGAGEAYLRLARFADAERELMEGVEAVQQMSWSPVPLVVPMLRAFEYTGRRDRIVHLGEELGRIPVGASRALGEVLLAAFDAVEHGDVARLARAEHGLEKADPSPFVILEVLVYGVAARLAHADVADLKLAVRRAQRMLDRLPSVKLAAQLKRWQALALCREGRLAEAVPLLEASIATFSVARDLPEAALGRHWLARVRSELEEPGAQTAVEASQAELAGMGLVVFPPTFTFGTFEGHGPESAAAAARATPRTTGLVVALERLSVRGVPPVIVRRELMSVTSDLFPGRAVVLEEILATGETRVVEERGDPKAPPPEDWFEFGDGRGARLRLGVGAGAGTRASGPPTPDDVLRLLTTVASLSLEIAALRGLAETPRPDRDEDAPDVPGLVAASTAMRKLRAEIARLGSSRATVILYGESGTGKEVLARAIHDLSSRAKGPYVTFNCAAIPRDLFEGQLFGYRRGAFTGAQADHPGVIRAANGGTLFLDEVGELPLELQPKLLRFLENREILPLGESRPIEVDVRTIAATHQDLAQGVRQGRFREDLYYRLQVVPLGIPPLRDRPDDVVALARHFVRTLTPEGAEPPVLAPDALSRLAAHTWPGNVRELRNVIERALAFAPLPRVLTAAHFRIGESTLRPPSR